MNLKELDSFKISDAVTFHDKLNPALWTGNKLRPEVKNQLEEIAKDFLEEMGINDLDVRDITISGSNAAFSYTPNSDLDLHILVNIADLPNNDIYKELFHAKKSLYNDNHDITIHGVPVELYVQDAAQPSITLGEYSLQNDKWLRIPTKRRANFDQTATRMKYEKLLDIVKKALASKNLTKIQKVLKKIKQYRQAGLDKGGEFGPENLAFKALRSQGYITKLYDLRDKLHSEALTIETMYQDPAKIIEDNLEEELSKEFEDYDPNGTPPGPEFKPTMPAGTVKVDVSEGINDPSLFKVVFVVGGPGSGKSYVSERLGLRALGFVPINSDIAFEYLMQKKGLDFAMPPEEQDERDIARARAKELTKKKEELAIDGRLGLIIDGTGGSWEKFVSIRNRLETLLGYESFLVFVDTSLDLALYRNQMRERKVPNKIVVKKWEQAQSNLTMYKLQFDKWAVIKNDSQSSEKIEKVHKQIASWARKMPTNKQAQQWIKQQKQPSLTTEASGYIPSNKEKNDPRYCTALTVDVHPDTIKKNAKAFGWLTTRAGIPPTAKPSGKI